MPAGDRNATLWTRAALAVFLKDDPPAAFLYWPKWIHGAKQGINYKPRVDGLVIVYDEVSFTQ